VCVCVCVPLAKKRSAVWIFLGEQAITVSSTTL
jgi:hypothetical protein